MTNYVNGSDMPMGLGMALAQNLNAMNRFATMSTVEQQAIIAHTHSIGSKEEMQAYVESLLQ